MYKNLKEKKKFERTFNNLNVEMINLNIQFSYVGANAFFF